VTKLPLLHAKPVPEDNPAYRKGGNKSYGLYNGRKRLRPYTLLGEYLCVPRLFLLTWHALCVR
jgi:hypothetical protein